jgi:hypothetical protein
MIKLKSILFEMSFKDFPLQKEYDKINQFAFDGKLEPVPLQWNMSKNRMGSVYAIRNSNNKQINITKLELSRYYDLEYKEYRNILAHEMIHVYLFQQGVWKDIGNIAHGVYFKKKMDELNSKGFEITINDELNHNISSSVKRKTSTIILIKYATNKSIIVAPDNKINDIIELIKNNKFSYDMHFIVLKTNNDKVLKYPVYRSGKLKYYTVEPELYDELIDDNVQKIDEFTIKRYVPDYKSDLLKLQNAY